MPSTLRLRFFPNLDTLRAIAALCVMFYHTTTWITYPNTPLFHRALSVFNLNGQAGQIGVHFFFILSGFLITYLMFLEKEDTGNFRLGAFYLRRILRIWPLYFLTLLVALTVWLYSPQIMSAMESCLRWSKYFLFLANFDIIQYNHSPNALAGIHWSVAIEEQFYLVWPALFLLTPRKWFPWMCAAMLTFSLVYFQYWSLNHMHVYFSTFTAVSSFACGGLLAWISFHHQDSLRALFGKIPPLIFPFFYVFVLAFLSYKGRLVEVMGMPKVLYHALGDVFFTILIAEQCFNVRCMLPAGKITLLDRIGKMSYGVYLLHISALALTVYLGKSFQLHWSLQVALAIFFTLSFSYISFHYFEKRFNDLRKKFSRIH